VLLLLLHCIQHYSGIQRLRWTKNAVKSNAKQCCWGMMMMIVGVKNVCDT
jgi:hypothetical protein